MLVTRAELAMWYNILVSWVALRIAGVIGSVLTALLSMLEASCLWRSEGIRAVWWSVALRLAVLRRWWWIPLLLPVPLRLLWRVLAVVLTVLVVWVRHVGCNESGLFMRLVWEMVLVYGVELVR